MKYRLMLEDGDVLIIQGRYGNLPNEDGGGPLCVAQAFRCDIGPRNAKAIAENKGII